MAPRNISIVKLIAADVPIDPKFSADNCQISNIKRQDRNLEYQEKKSLRNEMVR